MAAGGRARGRSGARASVGDAPAAVVEVPLLFEAGMEAVFDHTIAVVADEALRAERAGARGHAGGRASAPAAS